MKKFFKDTSNFLSFALAIVPAILFFIFQPATSVPYGFFVIMLLLLLLSSWLALKLYLDSKEISYPTIELFRCNNGKCLCKPNPYLDFHSVVSFYKNNNGFEDFICNGYVETITERGMIQITIMKDDNMEYFSYISTNQQDIIVKPTISIDAMRNDH